MPVPSTSSAGPSEPVPGAGRALALLLGINLFNYIDRQVLSAVLPRMQLDTTLFDPADPWLQTKAGALTTAFMITYMLLSPIFGRLGDRLSRWVIVGLAVAGWSLASGSSGIAHTYILVFLTRCLVGVGEAAYGPIAPAMISDLYPAAMRGKVIAWFYVAIPVGSALGFVIGGQVAEMAGDWRAAFWVTYGGLGLAAACFFMREPPRMAAPAVEGQSYFDVVRWLVKVPSFRYLTSGMTCTTFILGGAAVFLPLYIFQREARFDLTPAAVEKLRDLNKQAEGGKEIVPTLVLDKLLAAPTGSPQGYKPFQTHLSTTLTREELDQYGSRVFDAATVGTVTNGSVTLIFGVLLVVTGLAATILGGIAGDKLRLLGIRGAYFHTAGWTTLLGWPCFIAVFFTPFPLAWVFVGLALFFLFFNTGPANTVLANVAPSAVRATCFAINILVIHALGDAISPTLIGFVADQTDLHTAVLLASLFIPAGGILWILGARHLDADTARATALDAENPPAA